MANVEEVKAQVAASVDGTQRAVTGIQQVSDQLDDALALLRITAIGSLHPQVAAAIAQLEQARTRRDGAATLARSARNSADAYRMIVGPARGDQRALMSAIASARIFPSRWKAPRTAEVTVRA